MHYADTILAAEIGSCTMRISTACGLYKLFPAEIRVTHLCLLDIIKGVIQGPVTNYNYIDCSVLRETPE